MPTLEQEVSFINGLNPDGTVAATSFWTWGNNSPATFAYSTTSGPGKWGASQTAGTGGGTVYYWFDAASHWNGIERNAFISTMTLWSDLANIHFALAPDAASAQLTFKRGNDGKAYESMTQAATTDGHSLAQYLHSTISIDTSVWGFGPIDGDFHNVNGYVWQTIVHEIGHALGLGHGGAYNGNVDAATQQYSAYDSRIWTLMSYVDPSFNPDALYHNDYPVNVSWITDLYYANYPTTPMALDILAVQALYGAPATTDLSGGQVFGFSTNIHGPARRFFDFTVNTAPVITLWDLGTGNTLNLSGFTTSSVVDLTPGSFSSCAGMTNNLCIAFDTVINTAIGGTADDTLKANGYGDVLKGMGGADLLVGGAGLDKLYGGAGDDTYQIGTGDKVFEQMVAGVDDGGTDTVVAGFTYALGVGLENLTLTGTAAIKGTGNELNNVLIGNDSANTLTGKSGNDLLDGKGGVDRLFGGPGDDTYVVDSNGELVSEQAVVGIDDGGIDTVDSGVTFTLGAFVENLTLSGAALIKGTGNSLDNIINGNSSGNTISGMDGDDTLAGHGGNDKLTGGNGRDTFVFDHFGAANGVDTITDFASNWDYLSFTAADFGWSAGHNLTEFAFNAASGPGAQFVFNTSTSTLYWDSNGEATGGQTRIAILTGVFSLSTLDFHFT